jgi:hypothetical protein
MSCASITTRAAPEMLRITRAPRGNWLVAGVGDFLATPCSNDPFATEIVAVPTRPIER